jgi:hypothetical protein
MFHLLEAGKIVAPLYDAAQTPGVSNNHVRLNFFLSFAGFFLRDD